MKDSYLTIDAPSTGEFRDRGSKFYAYAFPVSKEEDWQNALLGIKKEHPKARHFCYAYRIGLDQNNFRANDDGEPSGTAGRPILGQIDSKSLTNTFIVVVRYFGGTLLGTSGLINAYRQAALEAISAAEISEKIIEDEYRLNFDYALMGEVMNSVKKVGVNVLKQHFEEIAFLEFGIRKSDSHEKLIRLLALISKVSIEEAQEMEWKDVEGIELKKIN